MPKHKSSAIVPASISQKIYFFRGQRVMLSTDLAKLYGVEVRALVQAVQRNVERFPSDFLFQLSEEEHKHLRSQIVISSWGGARRAPYAFTEQGVAMLSSILRSKRAVEVNIAIMRTFVRLREMLATNQKLRRKIEDMEKRYNAKFQVIFATIESMLEDEAVARPGIGFHAPIDKPKSRDS
ncbi:MAG TPA: ORF6N domain-containing protein [Candidatus Acidoferrum sp.]|nr:ORF6N domain-containing protein [Candidatus Acidoferrum sp.]